MHANLRTAMDRERITMDNLAECIDVHRNTVSNKINGETPFTYDEVVSIHRTHFPLYDMSWLFKRIGRKEETAQQ